MKFFAPLLAAFVLAAGCTAGGNVEAERAALLQADRDFARAAAERGLEGFLSFVAEEAIFFPAGAPVVAGKEAVGRLWSPILSTPGVSIDWEPQRAEVSGAGDLGYTSGSYQLTREGEEGESSSEQGKYVTIWKKQPDGGWKVVVDIGNADQPSAAGAEP